MIIGLSGHIGCGKDTVGMLIQALTMNEGSRWKTIPLEYVKGYDGRPNLKGGWEIKKFAGKLKEIASLLTGIPKEKFEDQEFKKTLLGKEWDQYRVTWKHGDDGPGSMCFKTAKDAHFFIEQNFEDSVDDIVGAGLLTFEEMTVRAFLQKLGTEAMRDGLHQQTWVNALFADYKPVVRKAFRKGEFVKEGVWKTNWGGKEVLLDTHTFTFDEYVYPNWIITDTRFPNEAVAIKERGGIVVRIEREDERFKKLELGGDIGTIYAVDKQSLHPSETALDAWEFDYVINNNGSLEDLKKAVETLLINIKN